MQIQGIASPSTTMVCGRTAIRVNITNHRTTRADLVLLVQEVYRIGQSLLKVPAGTFQANARLQQQGHALSRLIQSR